MERVMEGWKRRGWKKGLKGGREGTGDKWKEGKGGVEEGIKERWKE